MSDTTLVAVNVTLGLALVLLGIEMSFHPPKTARQLWAFRAAFGFIGVAAVWTSVVQSNRTASAQFVAQGQIHNDQLASQAKLSTLQGRLDTVIDIINSGASSSLDIKRIADSVEQFRSLSSLPNDALQGRAEDVKRRMAAKLQNFEFADIAFINRLADHLSDSKRLAIEKDRDRMRAKFGADNKPLIQEANSILAEIINRPALSKDHDDLLTAINRLNNSSSPVSTAKAH